MRRILLVVGTRPNFIKVTRFKQVALAYPGLEVKIVHTGQHYDSQMADIFFKQFGLVPDFFLDTPPGSPNQQMAEIMLRLENVFKQYQPHLVMVVGDVNSTLAAALCAHKSGLALAHLESGLRSYDDTMPEEHNRILTDKLSNYYFITEQSGSEALQKEGLTTGKAFFVGNTMIDTLVAFEPEIRSSDILTRLGLGQEKFVLMTMHRPATVDSREGLLKLKALISMVTKQYKLVFPVHPRTRKQMDQWGLTSSFLADQQLILCDPLDYFAFQKLVSGSTFILTDSGGIQEESTYLGIPCLTLRPNTERPVTTELGTNELVPFDLDRIANRISAIGNGTFKKGQIPPLWDGKATERILRILDEVLPLPITG
ncbi:MAG TPA: UDP-N-acetylglucosamine 2-epimerase (non-hydrolyzing) [Bacteroidia bacterium]|jgi:UDP-N-acetylglucosamine 2-epimerase (non-hydrolysing)|nr:UDP-N-acetylglucosamine 2-epimerase (non-hydrolyzing) [Bacteroidia bacterium]